MSSRRRARCRCLKAVRKKFPRRMVHFVSWWNYSSRTITTAAISFVDFQRACALAPVQNSHRHWSEWPSGSGVARVGVVLEQSNHLVRIWGCLVEHWFQTCWTGSEGQNCCQFSVLILTAAKSCWWQSCSFTPAADLVTIRSSLVTSRSGWVMILWSSKISTDSISGQMDFSG